MSTSGGRARAAGLRRSLSEVTERIEETILEAEREAEQVRRQAAAEADRYLTRRRQEADQAVTERVAVLQEATGQIIGGCEAVTKSAEALSGELRTALPSLRALASAEKDRG